MRDSLLKPAKRIAVLYIVVSGLWILFSDQLVIILIADPQMRVGVQTAKGWLFVAVTGTLLYGLVLRSLKRLSTVALEDPLTQLPNRQAFQAELSERCRREGQYFCTSILDVDHFQDLNDEYGHAEGDDLLLALHRSLTRFLDDSWYIARLGGDEFGLLSPPSLPKKKTRETLDRLQRELTRTSDHPRLSRHTLCLGTSFFPSDGTTARDLMSHADMALFHAKTHGRDQHAIFNDDLKLRLLERLALIKDLKQACDEMSFELVYQPQWNMAERFWAGAEVLIRWHHPERGYVSPAEFIPLAEEQGLISRITDFVLNRALEEMQGEGIDREWLPRLSINLSHKALLDRRLMQRLVDQARFDSGRRPDLILEITETAAMENLQATLAAMEAWRQEGIAFSMDDFGTGYSSLAMLKRLPLSELKIDRSFIQDIPHDRNDEVITQTILAMARILALDVVAEGVETADQAAFLTQFGCATMQGFYFARPMPIAELKALLEKDNVEV